MTNFSKEITTAIGWQNLMQLLLTNGYEGYSVLGEVNFTENAANTVRVKLGHSSSAVAPASVTDGTPYSQQSERFENVDANMCWIYADGAYPVSITATSKV